MLSDCHREFVLGKFWNVGNFLSNIALDSVIVCKTWFPVRTLIPKRPDCSRHWLSMSRWSWTYKWGILSRHILLNLSYQFGIIRYYWRSIDIVLEFTQSHQAPIHPRSNDSPLEDHASVHFHCVPLPTQTSLSLTRRTVPTPQLYEATNSIPLECRFHQLLYHDYNLNLIFNSRQSP